MDACGAELADSNAFGNATRLGRADGVVVGAPSECVRWYRLAVLGNIARGEVVLAPSAKARHDFVQACQAQYKKLHGG
jgi:hypothetical protein